MKKLYFLCLTILISTASFGQTTLVAGDLVIIALRGDTTDEFRFIPLVNLDAGTQIYFTDSGWQGSNFRANEGGLLYTAPSLIAAGTNIGYLGSSSDIASNPNFSVYNNADLGSNGFNLSSSGDQVIAFQGSGATPTFVFAIQSNSTEWQVGSNDSNQSDLPTGLTAGSTAIAYGAGSGTEDEYDNIYYTGTTSGTKGDILAAVANTDNWEGSNSSSTIISTDFTISTAGLSDNNIENFGVYPNPVANGKFRITTALNVNKEVRIFNMFGKQVYSKTVRSNEIVDVSNLNTGVYFVNILEEGKTATKKLVIR